MKKLTKRQLLGMGIGAGFAATASAVPWKNLSSTKQAPKKQGKISFDSHTHINKKNKFEDILNALSGRLTALTPFNNLEEQLKFEHLQEAIAANYHFTSIDGTLGKIEYRDNEPGYVLRSQEIKTLYGKLWQEGRIWHDVLALGFKGKYFQDGCDINEILEEIHNPERDGFSIIPHMMVVDAESGWIIPKVMKQPYRLLTSKEYGHLKEPFQMADEIEIDNGQCIDCTPFLKWIPILFPKVNMVRANRLAQKHVKEDFPKKIGTASSDTKNILETLHTRAIYLDEPKAEPLSHGYIKKQIQIGDFERFPENLEAQTINAWDWLRGAILYK